MYRLQFVIGLLLVTFIPASFAQTTWYVDDDAPNDPVHGDPTVSDPNEDGSAGHPFDAIQEGIDAAVDGDTVLVLDGTYTGDGNRDLDYGGRLITVRSENGPESCVIDCQASSSDQHRGFYFHTSETADAVVDGFTIRNGYAGSSMPPELDPDMGGGMCSLQSSPTVTNCTFSGNEAEYGGGMYTEQAQGIVERCAFMGNKAISGGGLYSYQCNGIVAQCTFSGNVAQTTGTGGGMHNENGSPTVRDCAFCGNFASFGGGMHNWYSSAAVINCTFSGNTTYNPFFPGGVGGGLSTDFGSSKAVNCIVVGNCAESAGGGMFWSNNQFSISSCVFSANVAFYGGAVYANATLVNCVVWGCGPNPDPNYPADPISSWATVAYSCVEDGWPGGSNIDADPLFVGGPSGTWTADGVYDPNTYQVTFTDADASWSEGELVGKFVDPDLLLYNELADIPLPIQLPIIANTATAITVWADWMTIDAGASWVMSGASYQIYDYHLTNGSPCIDAGCNCGVPADTVDLDDDGDTDEPTPLDLDGKGRFFDDPNTPNTGSGWPPIVDMGAYEFGGTGLQPCFGDLDNDRDVDLNDLAELIGDHYGSTSGMTQADGDLDCDGDVELADLAALLGVYGTECE